MGLILYICDTSPGCFGNISIGIPIAAHRPRAALPATFFDGLPFRRVHDGIWSLHDLVIFNPTIRRKVNDGVTEVIIKSMGQRTVRNWLVPVKGFRAIKRTGLLVFRGALLGSSSGTLFKNGIPIPTQMPFANGGSCVALRLEHLRYCQSLGTES